MVELDQSHPRVRTKYCMVEDDFGPYREDRDKFLRLFDSSPCLRPNTYPYVVCMLKRLSHDSHRRFPALFSMCFLAPSRVLGPRYIWSRHRHNFATGTKESCFRVHNCYMVMIKKNTIESELIAAALTYPDRWRSVYSRYVPSLTVRLLSTCHSSHTHDYI